MKLGMGGHHGIHPARTDEWFTPPEIIDSLGAFDDDPCLPGECNGLIRSWNGRVWMNPPYGRTIGPWLDKLATHGNGIALVFARTETQWFFEHVWARADALLFLRGRLRFLLPNGQRPKGTCGAPSVLIAYGRDNVDALERSKLAGFMVLPKLGWTQ